MNEKYRLWAIKKNLADCCFKVCQSLFGNPKQIKKSYLNARYWSFFGRCDPLLQSSQICWKGWLVPNCTRNPTEQSGNFGPSLCVTKNIVDEKQIVLSCLISEMLRNSQCSESNAGTCSWRLIHLTIDQHNLVKKSYWLKNKKLNIKLWIISIKTTNIFDFYIFFKPQLQKL